MRQYHPIPYNIMKGGRITLRTPDNLKCPNCINFDETVRDIRIFSQQPEFLVSSSCCRKWIPLSQMGKQHEEQVQKYLKLKNYKMPMKQSQSNSIALIKKEQQKELEKEQEKEKQQGMKLRTRKMKIIYKQRSRASSKHKKSLKKPKIIQKGVKQQAVPPQQQCSDSQVLNCNQYEKCAIISRKQQDQSQKQDEPPKNKEESQEDMAKKNNNKMSFNLLPYPAQQYVLLQIKSKIYNPILQELFYIALVKRDGSMQAEQIVINKQLISRMQDPYRVLFRQFLLSKGYNI